VEQGHLAEEAFFVGHPLALAVYRKVCSMLDPVGPVDVRTTRSQVAFRRRRSFAYLWLPGRWLAKPSAEVVLSLALDHRADSPRFKDVAHPAREVWMHHLEVRGLDDLDDEVLGWLREAFEHAA
jgi:Domain of unknown function (DUF5655)